MRWNEYLSKPEGLAHKVIRDIPKYLKKFGVTMHPLNTPWEVYDFVEFCKIMLEELGENKCTFKFVMLAYVILYSLYHYEWKNLFDYFDFWHCITLTIYRWLQ